MDVVMVNPSLARDWLGLNWDRNRYIRDARVLQYRQAMMAGQWRLTHQGIAFDKDGKLIDGQHRLSALGNINDPSLSVPFVVFYYVEACNGLGVLDIGAVRGAGDSMTVMGLVNRADGRNTAATVSWPRTPSSRMPSAMSCPAGKSISN